MRSADVLNIYITTAAACRVLDIFSPLSGKRRVSDHVHVIYFPSIPITIGPRHRVVNLPKSIYHNCRSYSVEKGSQKISELSSNLSSALVWSPLEVCAVCKTLNPRELASSSHKEPILHHSSYIALVIASVDGCELCRLFLDSVLESNIAVQSKREVHLLFRNSSSSDRSSRKLT